MSQRAIFLDRDGVINVDHGYVSRPDEVEFIPGAREMIAELSRQGWFIFVVTNQSGVARGMYTEEDVQALHRWLNEEFAQMGGNVTEFFYCPHLLHAKVKEYDVDCVCRKPRPGMIIQALSKHRIAREDAFLIGDSERDVAAAERAGIRGFLFTGGNVQEFMHECVRDLSWN